MSKALAKGIRLTPSGTYEATINHKLLPRGRASRNFPTLEAATAYRRAVLAELDAGNISPEVAKLSSDAIPLSAMLDQYLLADTVQISPSDRPMVSWLKASIPGMVSSINHRWVDNWVREMKTTDGIAPGTIRKRVESLARALDWWNRQTHPEQLFSNPLRMLPRGYSTYGENDLRAGAKKRVDTKRDRRLLPGEEKKIEEAIMGVKAPDRERPIGPDQDMLMFFRLIVNTGLRLREAYRLRMSDLKLDHRVIRVRKSKTDTPRDVPVTRQLETWLRAYLKEKGPEEPVFPYWAGVDDDEYLKTCSARVSARFRRIFNYIGAHDLTEHDLRHEATCRWLEKKNATGHWLYRPEEVRRITGHKSVQMFERYLSLRGTDLAVGLD